MMENRSFDHFLSWLPGADGRHDLTFPSADGNMYRNYPLAPDFQGCGYSDPDHSWEGFLVQHNFGKMDGFLQRPTAPADNAQNLGDVLEGHPHHQVDARAIPTSSDVPGPANDAAAVCSAASVQSVAPAPVRFGKPPVDRPVFPRSGWPTGSGMAGFGRKNWK